MIGGWAAPNLLDSYEAERWPIATELARLTEQRQARRTGSNPKDDRADDLLWTLDQRYWSDAIIVAEHDTVFGDELDLRAQAGTRAPHLWLGAQRCPNRRPRSLSRCLRPAHRLSWRVVVRRGHPDR